MPQSPFLAIAPRKAAAGGAWRYPGMGCSPSPPATGLSVEQIEAILEAEDDA
jgi:hypothetical protein